MKNILSKYQTYLDSIGLGIGIEIKSKKIKFFQ